MTFRRGDGDLPVCCCLSKTGVSLSHLEAKSLSSARTSANCSVRTSSVADLVGLVSSATLAASNTASRESVDEVPEMFCFQ